MSRTSRPRADTRPLTLVAPDPSPPEVPVTPTGPNRRQMLCGLAAAVAAPGVLAACSSPGQAPGQPAPSPSAPAMTTAAPAGASVPLDQVPVGGGVIVRAGRRPILVVQPAAGTVKAFDASCPHAGTTVDPPQGGVVICPNHFSQFDAATGAVRKGPADTGLAEVPARLVDGVVQVA